MKIEISDISTNKFTIKKDGIAAVRYMNDHVYNRIAKPGARPFIL